MLDSNYLATAVDWICGRPASALVTQGEDFMEAVGIEAVQEMITAVMDLAVTVAEVVKDGKIDLWDVGALMSLIGHQGDFMAAIRDAKNIPAEVTDLSDDEIKTLVETILKAVRAVREA
jgi:hypothetical protein